MPTKKEATYTKKDIERMKSMRSSKSIFFIYIFFLVPAIISLVSGIQKFFLAQKYAEIIGKNMSEIFNGLNHGFSPRESYAGAYCLAIDNLRSSIDAFTGTAVILCLLAIIITISRMHLRIINLFEKKTNGDGSN